MSTGRVPSREFRFECRDGLSLFCRDYGPVDTTTIPVLCLPGLTRNSKDFIDIAERHGHYRRVLCPDLRGRGLSDWDPDWQRYRPGTYVEDMWELLGRLNVGRAVVIGTSLGGLMAMIMATSRPESVTGVVLNDIGPEVDPAGLARVSAYVGRLPAVANWPEAVAQSREVYEIALPDLTDAQWLRFTQCQYREDKHGAIELEYDPNLGRALREVGGVPFDPWTLYEALRPIPALAFRGTISDILMEQTFERMGELKPDLGRVYVPNRGHVPVLDEPVCVEALDDFLGQPAFLTRERPETPT